MSQFSGFVRKEFYHIFRDARTILVLFAMPVLQILLFGYVISTEVTNSPIAILDHSKDALSREITSKITSSGFFILEQNLENEKEIENIFKKGRIKLVIVFPSDFSNNVNSGKESTIQILADASDPNTASILVSYIEGIITNWKMSKLQSQQAVMIMPEIRMFYNESLKSAYMFVPGTMALILMLISAMMTSVSIAREKEMGTMEVLLVSPLKPFQIIVGKVIPYVLLSFINAIVIIALGNLIFQVPVKGSLILLLIECMLYITLALSLGILISTMSKTQQTAMFISMFALMLPTMLLSGFIFPIENLPWPLQILSTAMPPRWFIYIIKDIMLRGNGFLAVIKETGILVGINLIIILISIKKFKIRLE